MNSEVSVLSPLGKRSIRHRRIDQSAINMQSVSIMPGPVQRSLVRAAVQSVATFSAARPVGHVKARIARYAPFKIFRTVAGHSRKVHTVVARAAAAAAPPAMKAPAGETLVLGCAGQLAARVALELLKAGGRVTAALDDEEEAAAALRFATSLEIVSAAEAKALRTSALDPRDPEALEAVLPRRGGMRVVLVLGDAAGRERRRADPRVYSAILAALAEVSGRVSQLVLISPAEKGTGVFGRRWASQGRASQRLATQGRARWQAQPGAPAPAAGSPPTTTPPPRPFCPSAAAVRVPPG